MDGDFTPSFTSLAFIDTPLVLCAFLAVITTTQCISDHSSPRHVRAHWLVRGSLITCALLAFLPLAEALHGWVYYDDNNVSGVDTYNFKCFQALEWVVRCVSWTIQLLCFVTLLPHVYLWSFLNRIRLLWFFALGGTVVRFNSDLHDQLKRGDMSPVFFLSSLSLLLHLFLVIAAVMIAVHKYIPRPVRDWKQLLYDTRDLHYTSGRRSYRRPRRSFCSKLTFSWVQGLMSRGYNEYLDMEDMLDVYGADDTWFVRERFSRAWTKEKGRKELRTRKRLESMSFHSFDSPLLGHPFSSKNAVSSYGRPDMKKREREEEERRKERMAMNKRNNNKRGGGGGGVNVWWRFRLGGRNNDKRLNDRGYDDREPFHSHLSSPSHSPSPSSPSPFSPSSSVFWDPSYITDDHDGDGGGKGRGKRGRDKPRSPPPQPEKPSLITTFNVVFGTQYYWLAIVKFTADMIGFAGPLLLEQLILFLDRQGTPQEEPTWQGYLYASLLSLSVICGAIISSQYTYAVQSIARRVRTSIISLVYSKSLKITEKEKLRFGVGQITNIMSVDTSQAMNGVVSFHEFWSLPVQITVALILLYRQVGVALVAGVGIIVLLIPINMLLTKKIAENTAKMLVEKDKR